MEQTPPAKPESRFSKVMDMVTAIFLPIVNHISAAGITKGLVAGLAATGVIAGTSGAYIILSAVGDGLFYFLPVLLAFTFAEKLGASRFSAVVVAAATLYPTITAAFDSGNMDFFGLPVLSVRYPYGVFAVLLSVGLLYWVEKPFRRYLPAVLKDLLTPFFSIIITVLATLLILGPTGQVIAGLLADGYGFVYEKSPVLAGALLSGTIQIMVPFGFQWGIVPIALQNLAETGTDTVIPFFAPPVFAHAGACLALFIRCRDVRYKSVLMSAFIAAMLGITEPSLFGVCLPMRRIWAAVCATGAVGGVIIALVGVTDTAFAFPGLVTLPIFIGGNLPGLLIASGVSMGLCFLVTMFMKIDFSKVTSN